jgi:hypothetical protein
VFKRLKVNDVGPYQKNFLINCLMSLSPSNFCFCGRYDGSVTVWGVIRCRKIAIEQAKTGIDRWSCCCLKQMKKWELCYLCLKLTKLRNRWESCCSCLKPKKLMNRWEL